MRRKIVKHGPSSFIVSLPLKWIRKHNLSKGDEVDVEEMEENVVISTEYKEKCERADLDMNDTKEMTIQKVCALYKRGIDEIRINYDHPEDFKIIQNALYQEAIGYEIISTTHKSCTIRSITKLTKEFDAVLRRVFLVTLSLADEGLKAVQNRNFEDLDNIIFLEKSNNKLTTFCQRYINKYSIESHDRIGPIYFIIELLEKVADEYKYLFEHQCKLGDSKIKYNKKLLASYTEVNRMLRLFYECFYKFDYKKIREIKSIRDKLTDFLEKESTSINGHTDLCLYHHAVGLVEKIFALVDPLLVLTNKK